MLNENNLGSYPMPNSGIKSYHYSNIFYLVYSLAYATYCCGHFSSLSERASIGCFPLENPNPHTSQQLFVYVTLSSCYLGVFFMRSHFST